MVKSNTDYDVVIVGAGISGINFAYQIQAQHPDLTYTILEGRNAMGGTWDYFKYPGLRSDSDLYTFGFPWHPWNAGKSIAEAGLILDYLKESTELYGIDKKIQYRHQVASANWSSDQQAWSLSVDADGQPAVIRTRFTLFCTGYYDYKEPLPTVIPGIEKFQGPRIYPQFWPEDLDYSGKNIVIIGSGATAVTILPVMAETASHVTMLQRSPGYLLSMPKTDALERLIRWTCPTALAHRLVRLKWILTPMLLINMCYYFPNYMKGLFRRATIKALPPTASYDLNFTPAYNPFEQRVCLCPDGDFFAALRSGKASVVTDTIAAVTEKSIQLHSGQELHPDIIVTATGLKLLLGGGIRVTVDNVPYHFGENFLWKGVMLQDLPNAAFTIGYVDASWTLGANATALLVCRLLADMKRDGIAVVVPTLTPAEAQTMREVPLLKLNSTYIKKGKSAMPKTGDSPQWRGRTLYFRDMWEAKFGDLKTGAKYLKAHV